MPSFAHAPAGGTGGTGVTDRSDILRREAWRGDETSRLPCARRGLRRSEHRRTAITDGPDTLKSWNFPRLDSFGCLNGCSRSNSGRGEDTHTPRGIEKIRHLSSRSSPGRHPPTRPIPRFRRTRLRLPLPPRLTDGPDIRWPWHALVPSDGPNIQDEPGGIGRLPMDRTYFVGPSPRRLAIQNICHPRWTGHRWSSRLAGSGHLRPHRMYRFSGHPEPLSGGRIRPPSVRQIRTDV
jgi:hypothetical protein